jgi:hypothetical protein
VAAGAYWRCPICLRRVPDKIGECYCGRVRQPGDGPDAADRAKPFPTASAMLAVALVSIAVLAIWVTRPSRPTAAIKTSSTPPDEGVAPSAAPSPGEGDASPAPTTTTLPGSARAYDFALGHLRQQIRQLEALLGQFERSCGPGSRHSGCASMGDQVAERAATIRAAFDAAEAKARQESVDGGLLMDLRQRNGVTEGDVQAVLSRARGATAGR